MKLLLAVVALLAISGGSLWAVSPCPAIGNDTNGCEFVITVTAVNGSGLATAFTVAASVPDQGPFDGCDDTLVGIVNSSGSTLKSINLSGSVGGTGIFAFDGEGACSAVSCTNGAGDTSGYGGPGVNYTNISGGDTSGTVNFGCTGIGTCAGIANGASAWFSLEDALTASVLAPPPTTPIPSSILLMFTGLAAIAMVYFVKGRFASAN